MGLEIDNGALTLEVTPGIAYPIAPELNIG